MIGIIGGYGDIGHHVVEALLSQGNETLLIGARKQKDMFYNYKSVKYQYVDLGDESSLEDFAKKCTVIINCSGLNESMTEKLLCKVQKYQCNYIEPQFNKSIKKQNGNTNIIVQGVGSMPGLSGVLPVFLSEKFQGVKGVKLYYIGQGKFTPKSSKDFLDGMFDKDNLSMVRYEQGKVYPNFIKENEILPAFNKRYMLLPYFDREAKEICKFLSLDYAEFYIALENNLTYRVLRTAREKYKKNPRQTIEDLCNASQIDSAKYGQCGFVVSIEGTIQNQEKLVTLILKADNASSLTGLAIASMANILIKERNRPNNSVLSMWQYQTYIPELAKEIVDSSGVYTEEYTCSIETLSEMEEGEI